MRRGIRRRPFAAALAGMALVASMLGRAGAAETDYRHGDESVVALNILPPGEGRYLNAPELVAWAATGAQPASNTNQLATYEALVAKAPTLSHTDLASLFKDASFGVRPDDVGRTYTPKPGTSVIRDKSYDVPHVYGATRADTMFGAGYVSAEDRLFMMDVLRHLARGRLSEFLGGSESNLASDRAQRQVADYTEEELTAMGTRLIEVDHELGTLALADITAFSAGANQFIHEALLDPQKLPAEYPALQVIPRDWTPNDSIALATLIGGQFSVGGGGQLRNAAFLNGLLKSYSVSDAREIFDDLRFANDPEAPVSTDTAFPFNDPPSAPHPDALAMPDDPAAALASVQGMPESVDGPFGKIPLRTPKPASNALLVPAAKSEDGRPIAVFGPQVGYYSPQILMEIDLHGPGVHARGAAFPGISIYVLLGRGTGYGWSATTAIGDHIDVRAVKLCNVNGSPATTSSTGYERDGVCHPMYRRTDTWLAKPSAGGVPDPSGVPGNVVVQMTTERVRLGTPESAGYDRAGLGALPIGPDWAIVVARGTVDGAPVAFARQRSSYGIEVDATLTYVIVHDPARVNSIQDLQHAFCDRFSFSFNWHLIDADSVGFCTTGRYPVLASGVDGDLPYWGDSHWDWTRYLTYAEHPQTVDPAKGYITNWNNKQAPHFRAADDWWAYGPVGRMSLLEDGVKAALASGGTVSLAELVRAMALGATQDLRGVEVLPSILAVLGTPADPKLAHVTALLHDWVENGAHRRDLNGDGTYEEAAAVAVMDALWLPALHAAFDGRLGAAFGRMPAVIHDAPGPGGSSFLEGWYGHLQKDLRQLIGDATVAQPFSRSYCGNGSVSACRAALTEALVDAVAAVEAAYGADEAGWGDDLKDKDAIQFSPVGMVEQEATAWQNRPTFQQVLEFAP